MILSSKNKISFRELWSFTEIILYLKKIISGGLYLEGGQAFDFFNYVLKYPKATIKNFESKDYSLKRLLVAEMNSNVIAWIAECQFVEQELNDYIIFSFTHPKFRNLGINYKLRRLL